MNGWPLPASLIEAGNWMMTILFGSMLISAALYFIEELRRHKWQVWFTYYESKASWAAAILFFGLFLRSFDIALVRHFQNHGRDVAPAVADTAATWLLISTLPIVWGAICWMRAVLPLSCGPWAWVFLATFAIGTGIYLAS